ncbi:hypothetical protein H4582DRAFT_122281 [Lactarius indigo]|nr:hypothetical protein H4582DRAFT_122281 [Lactarius indigo]
MQLFSPSHRPGPTINLCHHMVPAYPTLLPVRSPSKRAPNQQASALKLKRSSAKRQKSETDTDDDDDVEANVGANMPRPNRLPGACTYCKRLKMKCTFPPGENVCKRCKTGKHDLHC